MKHLRSSLILVVIATISSLSACQINPTPTQAPTPTLLPSPSLTPTPTIGMASVNGVQIYYEIQGEGESLILLHGGLGNTNDWKNQFSVFSEHYQVIVLDSRGCGRSPYSGEALSYSLMASDVIALMDYLGIKQANILGWSDGGIIALDLAINHPDRLLKVIAYGANYNLSGVRTDLGESEKFAKRVEQAAQDYQKLSPNPKQWESLVSNTFQMWSSEPNFTKEQLGNIAIPMMILDGDNDGAVYAEHTKEMASLIPGAKLALIKDTGHFALWEKTEEFNKVVLEFLAP
jgi:pimeloyl-ACP methyl ester carboxylesterase